MLLLHKQGSGSGTYGIGLPAHSMCVIGMHVQRDLPCVIAMTQENSLGRHVLTFCAQTGPHVFTGLQKEARAASPSLLTDSYSAPNMCGLSHLAKASLQQQLDMNRSQDNVGLLCRTGTAAADERLKVVGPSAGPSATLHQQEKRRAARRAGPTQRPVRQEEQLAACARPRVLAVRLDLGHHKNGRLSPSSSP